MSVSLTTFASMQRANNVLFASSSSQPTTPLSKNRYSPTQIVRLFTSLTDMDLTKISTPERPLLKEFGVSGERVPMRKSSARPVRSRDALRVVGFLFIFLLAGCASPATTPEEGQPPALPFNSLVLTGCHGGGANFDVPDSLLNTPVPPGWDGEMGITTTVRVMLASCDHLSLGPFERGPISLAVESHSKFNAPENCRDGDYAFMNILTRMVWSDGEVAAAVERELGIPSSTATFSTNALGDAQLSSTTLEWTIDGRQSSIQIGRFEDDVVDALRTYRYVWPSDGHLGLIDFSWDARQTVFEPTAVYATFSSPMLIASTGMPIVAGVGALDEEFVGPGGTFRFFEGYECAKELPS